MAIEFTQNPTVPSKSLFHHRDDDKDVYFVLDGCVRVNIHALSGKEIAFRDMDAGSTFGEIAALDGEPRSATVTAMTDSTLASVDATTFVELMRNHPKAAEAMLVKMANLVRSLSDRVFEFAAPVPTRVCAELLRMARQAMISENTSRLVPAPKHGDIASRVGTHREAVSRTMGELREHKIVRRGQGELLVTDVAGLEALVQSGHVKA